MPAHIADAVVLAHQLFQTALEDTRPPQHSVSYQLAPRATPIVFSAGSNRHGISAKRRRVRAGFSSPSHRARATHAHSGKPDAMPFAMQTMSAFAP